MCTRCMWFNINIKAAQGGWGMIFVLYFPNFFPSTDCLSGGGRSLSFQIFLKHRKKSDERGKNEILFYVIEYGIMFVIHDWGGWLILLASSGVWADSESENDCFSALSFADEQMWECVYDREAETDGFRVRVMNGLKACSSWSLYDDRYDMTNILVTSNDEGEREWEWIKRSSWRGWMKKSDVWIWVAHWVVKKNEKNVQTKSQN